MSDKNNSDIPDSPYHLEIEQKYNIVDKYESAYMSDTYNSEEYNSLKSLTEGIPVALDKFLECNPEYDDVRKVDINKIKVGDVVTVSMTHHYDPIYDPDEYDGSSLVQKYQSKVISIGDNEITVSLDEFVYDKKCHTPRIFPIVECSVNKNLVTQDTNCIFRLKQQDIALLYMGIKSKMPSGISGDIEYFYVFTEYFKINEKICYSSLSAADKFRLNDELEERTGIPSSRGNFSLKW